MMEPDGSIPPRRLASARSAISFRLGVSTLVVLLTCAVFAPVLAPDDPTRQTLAADLDAPSLRHPFGRDKLGRDQLSRIIYGARISLAVGTSTVVCSVALGIAVGAIAGYLGGGVDFWIMRLVDILLAFPGILLAIAMSAALGPSLTNVIVALSLIGWTGYACLVRVEVIAIMRRPHVEAARALGVSAIRLITRHVLPIAAGPVVVQATFGMAAAVVAEASLSFLGLGVQPPTPSWGSMVNESRAFLLIAPHLAVFPGAAIFATVLSLSAVGEGLRERLDVRASTERMRTSRIIADNGGSRSSIAAPSILA